MSRRPIPGAQRRQLRAGLADRERHLRPAIRRFLQEINAVVSTEALAVAARAGTLDPTQQDRLLRQTATRMDELIRSWQRPLEELLIDPSSAGPRGVRKAVGDDLPLELLRTVARAQVGALIRDLTGQQLETVRTQLAAIMRHGVTPEILAAIADTTGLTARQAAAVRNTYEQLVEEHGAAAAIRSALAHRDRLLRYRATLIARTEATRYLGAVVQARGRQMGGQVVKAWVSARDADVDGGSPIGPCAIADNGQWIPIGAAFPNGLQQPPAHPGCRCLLEIQQLDREEAA